MLELCLVSLFLFFFLFHPPLAFSSLSFQNSSFRLCHYHDMMSLLHFKTEFTIVPSYCGYAKTESWKEGVDCCSWDGITCDSISGNVVGLDLSCSYLSGNIHHNSSLFHLHHLHSINLAYNDFNSSRISPNFGHYSGLKVLNLSYSNFAGNIPVELHLLSRLVLLDLSKNVRLQMPHIDMIMKNMTNLKQLHLGYVSINSSLPQSLANLSSLTSLDLPYCNLEGAFSPVIWKLPHLRSLVVHDNPNLFVNPSQFNNLSTSLEVLFFSHTNMSGKLPEYSFESQPPQLREIYLDFCNIYGSIPTWIWNTTRVISLADNEFSGGLPLTMNPKVLSQLNTINVRGNILEGSIPFLFFTLPSLYDIDFSSNYFSGRIDEASPIGNSSLQSLSIGENSLSFELHLFSKMENLIELYLSYNDISVTEGVNNTFYWPNLLTFYLRSCNMSVFPNISSSKNLTGLDISDNKIQGEIPTWLYGVGIYTLFSIEISHNNFTGGIELLPWNALSSIDISFNSFQGLLPFPPPSTFAFLASNNRFHGEISSSFCSLTGGLTYLALSNNQLSGELPSCFGKLSDNLQVLDLGSNLFHGIISINFKKNCSLISLHLEKNGFEGNIPSFLKRCKSMQVLNLGYNHFNGTFPSWLDTLPTLQVLILKSNNFQGSIRDRSKRNIHPFPNLQILDLSGNYFSGRFPETYFKNFKALMFNNSDDTKQRLKYIENFQGYYQDSLVLTAKGTTLTYQILTVLAAIDLSNNWFSGEIPYSVSQLTALVFLNFSHNQLSGHIPPSLANLNSLESLDISCNELEGNIPPELVRLTFLEMFNVSDNQLVGPIPLGSQFNTFSSDSYIGNPGLCGDPLPKCGVYNHHPETPSYQSDFFDFITRFSLWEIISIGFGFGTILGFIVGGSMLFTLRPLWFSREVEKLEYKMVQSFKKHSRRT